jgi:hypothetical protein
VHQYKMSRPKFILGVGVAYLGILDVLEQVFGSAQGLLEHLSYCIHQNLYELSRLFDTKAMEGLGEKDQPLKEPGPSAIEHQFARKHGFRLL